VDLLILDEVLTVHGKAKGKVKGKGKAIPALRGTALRVPEF
jgi:hypothetical protein